VKTGLFLAAAISLVAAPASADDLADSLDLRLGAYVQPGFTWVANSTFNDADDDGFAFANARLTGEGRRAIIPDLDASFAFNFDVNQGNFDVKDVYASLDWRDGFVGLDVGQLKTPFGLALLQSEARLQLPLSPRIRVLSFDRDLGAQLRGRINAPRGVGIDWWAMIANGEGGFRQRRNADNAFLYVGRVEITPLGSIDPGEPDLFDSDLRIAVGINGGYTPELGSGLGLDDVGAKEHRGGGDIRLHWHGLSARAEYLYADRGNNPGSPSFTRYGFHGQLGYVLPWTYLGVQLEPVLRFEQIDLNEDLEGDETGTPVLEETETRIYEAGFSLYLAGHSAKLHAAYRRTDLLEGIVNEPDPDGGTRPLLHDSVIALIQLGWL
jgi:hypothetical protein